MKLCNKNRTYTLLALLCTTASLMHAMEEPDNINTVKNITNPNQYITLVNDTGSTVHYTIGSKKQSILPVITGELNSKSGHHRASLKQSIQLFYHNDKRWISNIAPLPS